MRQLPEDKLSRQSLRQPADALSETWPSSQTHGNHTARRRNTGAPSAEAPSRWQTPGSTSCPLPESECGDRRWLSPAWGIILKASRRSKRLSEFSLTAGWIGAGAALLPTAQLSQWLCCTCNVQYSRWCSENIDWLYSLHFTKVDFG